MTNNSSWLMQLTAGSEVAYGHCKHSRPTFAFSQVKAISPTRTVITLESGHKFDKDGEEKGDVVFRKSLWEPEEARQRIATYEAAIF